VRDNVINDAIDEHMQATTTTTSTTTTTQYNSVDDWLADIKMHRYQTCFSYNYCNSCNHC